MTINCWPLDAVSSNPNYTGEMLRQTTGGVIGGKTATRTLGARSGVWPGTPSTVVSIASTTVTVGVHGGVMDAETSATAGPYVYAVSVAPTLTINAADATNPRVDLISLQLSDPAEGDGTSTPGVAAVYTAGTAASSPVAPTAPARSLVLAQVNVPHTGGGAATISFVAPYATAAGGIVPTASSTSYPASPYEGNYVDDATLNTMRRWSGSAWQTMAPTADIVQYLTFAPSGNLDSPASGSALWATLGNVTVPTWASTVRCQLSINGLFCNGSLGQVKIFLHVGGPGAGGDVYGDNAGSVRRSFSSIILVGGLTAGSQSVTVTATFVTGTNFRVDANCTISVGFDFLP